MPTSSGSEPGRKSAAILVVDDEKSVLALVRTMLWRAGYTVFEASGGEQALRVAAEAGVPIQLLLTDVLMPEMNGYELAAKFSAAYPDAKVLYISGYRDMVLTESTGHPVPEAPMVRKPFTAYTLIAKIQEMLDEAPVNAQPPSER